jgi:hypothetical protein
VRQKSVWPRKMTQSKASPFRGCICHGFRRDGFRRHGDLVIILPLLYVVCAVAGMSLKRRGRYGADVLQIFIQRDRGHMLARHLTLKCLRATTSHVGLRLSSMCVSTR